MGARFLKTVFVLLSFCVTYALAGQIIMTDEYRYVYRTWPELSGKSIDEVATNILDEYPRLKIKVLPARDGITSTILPNVVLLYQNEFGKVLNRPETVERTRIVIRRWPEVVGLTADEAKDIILKDVPDVQIQIVPEGSTVTADRDLDRVRIFVDLDQVVLEAPRTG